MLKRGQVTAFIVIGLVFLLIFGILLYFGYSLGTKQTDAKLEGLQKFSSGILKVKPYIDNCVKQQAVASLFLASKHDEDKLPPIKQIEETIEKYLEENIKICANFDSFREFEILAGNIKVDVDVLAENFIARIEWPITIKQNDLKVTQERFDIEFPLKLNELYIKAKNIEDSGSLDINTILEQDLNIEIIGCGKNKINYLINDEDYSVEGNILQFFFNTEIDKLGSLFEFKNGIKYLPFTLAGKQILRKENEAKRLLFETAETGFIEGCYESDNLTQTYNFGLVENNEITTTFSVKKPKTIYIRKSNFNPALGSKQENNTENNRDLFFDKIFEYSSSENFDSGVIIIKKSKDFASPKPSIYKLESQESDKTSELFEWKELETENEGEYYYANTSGLGTYGLGSDLCVRNNLNISINNSNKTEFKILFVSIDYENMTLFTEQVEAHSSAILDDALIKEFAKNNSIDISFSSLLKENDLHCLSFNSENCNPQAVRDLISSSNCNTQYDHIIALIENTVIGLDHTTQEGVSFIGSYLTFDKEKCGTCGTVEELKMVLG